MTIHTISNNIKLCDIIHPRIPPFIWDIVGYGGGLGTIFYYDKIGIIVFSGSFFMYGLLNMVFDMFSVSFEYSNIMMPNYKDLGNYKLYITNKKYLLQNTNKSNLFSPINMIDDSKLRIELSIYVGDYRIIKYLLFAIYLLGITKKNYTIRDYNIFKDTTVHYI